MAELYPFIFEGARAMVFVDGENLTMRYQAMQKASGASHDMSGWHRPDVAVWAQQLNPASSSLPGTRVIRKYYFTSEQGTDEKRVETADWLKSRGFEEPSVFRRAPNGRSKQVDISLCVKMLVPATHHHYDIAVLVAGDEDYVPLVRAVKAEGARVHLWFVSDGLAPRLQRECDYFVSLDGYFGV
jgi:uncharacterized LabA/DUF88 family protein